MKIKRRKLKITRNSVIAEFLVAEFSVAHLFYLKLEELMSIIVVFTMLD